MIRLLIVEDHHLVRTGLRNIINDAGGIEIVGEADSGERAIQLNREKRPHVILMDIGLPGLSGFETSERILAARPGVRIIALTAHAQPPFPARLLDLGAAGYLTKACDAAELVRAKVGRIAGAFQSVAMVMKGLPLAYSKDMQEDKQPAFEALDALFSFEMWIRLRRDQQLSAAAARRVMHQGADALLAELEPAGDAPP